MGRLQCCNVLSVHISNTVERTLSRITKFCPEIMMHIFTVGVQRVQRSLIFWASLKSHSLEKKWVGSLFHSHFSNVSALLIITHLKRVHSFFNHFFFQISNDFMSFQSWNWSLSFEASHFYLEKSRCYFLRIPKSSSFVYEIFEQLTRKVNYRPKTL